MSIPKPLAGVAGAWKGTYRLWLRPEDPVIESETTAFVERVGAERFLAMRYDWTYKDKPREGFILLGVDEDAGELNAQWLDSFHNSHRIMPCRGAVPAEDAEVSVLGNYPPPYPDWTWRTVLEHSSADELRLLMFNIPPGEPEALAVEAVYTRR